VEDWPKEATHSEGRYHKSADETISENAEHTLDTVVVAIAVPVRTA